MPLSGLGSYFGPCSRWEEQCESQWLQRGRWVSQGGVLNFHFGFQCLVKMFSLSACSRDREMHFKGLLWGFNPPQPSSSLATKCVWVCEKSFAEKRVWEEISVVRWAGELLPAARVGVAGVCLPPCSTLPEQCPGSAVLASLSLSLSSVPWYSRLTDNPSA